MSEAPVMPEVNDQETFNLERWSAICDDPVLASLDHRIETDRHGHILMTPPPGFDHGDFQYSLGKLIEQFVLETGKVATETPISTSEGVRAADVVWISLERLERSKKRNVLTIAPEICVEVLSPSNTRSEIEEKKRLYFEAGADEVWICDLEGRLFIYLADIPRRRPVPRSVPRVRRDWANDALPRKESSG